MISAFFPHLVQARLFLSTFFLHLTAKQNADIKVKSSPFSHDEFRISVLRVLLPRNNSYVRRLIRFHAVQRFYD